MVAWLRRQHERWRATRLITSVASTAVGLFGVWQGFRGEMAALIACIAVAAYGPSYSLGSWSGRPEVSLLLRLVDAEMKRAEEDSPQNDPEHEGRGVSP